MNSFHAVSDADASIMMLKMCEAPFHWLMLLRLWALHAHTAQLDGITDVYFRHIEQPGPFKAGQSM